MKKINTLKIINMILKNAGPCQLIDIPLFYKYYNLINIPKMVEYLFKNIMDDNSKKILAKLKLYEFFLTMNDSTIVKYNTEKSSIEQKIYKNLYKIFKHNKDKIIKWTAISVLRKLNSNSNSIKPSKYIEKAKIINNEQNLNINI